MRFKLFFILAISSLNSLNAQVVPIFSENFNNGFPASWTRWNLDGLTPAAAVSFVNQAWVAYEDVDSTGTGDSVAVATSFYDPSGIANDWMVTPGILLKDHGNILKWQVKSQDASYPDGYNVYIATSAVVDSFTANPLLFQTDFEYATWTDRQVVLDDVYGGQTVYIAFRAKSDDQFLILVDNVQLIADTTLSVNEISQERLEIYPNPATEQVNVAGTSVIQQIDLFDLSGKKQAGFTPMTNRFTIPVHQLEKGVYIVQAYFANGQTTQVKLIRQ